MPWVQVSFERNSHLTEKLEATSEGLMCHKLVGLVWTDG